jgi:hypothetical protein
VQSTTTLGNEVCQSVLPRVSSYYFHNLIALPYIYYLVSERKALHLHMHTPVQASQKGAHAQLLAEITTVHIENTALQRKQVEERRISGRS